ncbi:MAG TPA: hypothetical protein VGW31_00660 [Hanamia sp.]|jgi:hypothetical protein|nr:hypothetical protein [Hanamia sp.]
MKPNIAEIEDNNPIVVENLKVHVFAKGSRFSIKDRKMKSMKKAMKK